MNASSNMKSPSYFEIREFLADDGKIVRSEVSDLSKEMIQPLDAIPDDIKNNEKFMNNPELQERISDHLKKVGLVETNSEPDEHSKFVRELASISHSTSSNNFDDDNIFDEDDNQHKDITSAVTNDDYMDVLSSLIEQEEQNSAQRLKASRTPIAGNGWTKGFFGDKRKSKGSDKGNQKIIDAAKESEKVSSLTQGIEKKVTFKEPEQSSTTTKESLTSVAQESGFTNTRLQASSAQSTASRAFSGSIIERFP